MGSNSPFKNQILHAIYESTLLTKNILSHKPTTRTFFDFLDVSPLSELLEEFGVVCGWHGKDLPHWSVDGAKATMACS